MRAGPGLAQAAYMRAGLGLAQKRHLGASSPPLPFTLPSCPVCHSCGKRLGLHAALHRQQSE